MREVTQSLGPGVGETLADVVRNAEQALAIAEQTLAVAQQTLATGQQALAVARDTLATLKRSEQIQLELLETANEINRKIPGAPIFPESPAAPPSVEP